LVQALGLFSSARSIAVEIANDAGVVACNKPEAQAKGIERYVLLNALRLRFRLVSRLLKVRADELTHWLSVEDTRNETRWAKRLAARLEARWGE